LKHFNYPRIDLNAPAFIASYPTSFKIPVVASFKTEFTASLTMCFVPVL